MIIKKDKNIKKIKINNKEYELDITNWDANSIGLLVSILCFLTLNNKKINKILKTFEVNIKDKNGKIINLAL
jgi:H+/gluconate symporter-like permease